MATFSCCQPLAFIALILFLLVTSWLGISSIALALLIVLIVGVMLTALWGWAIERLAYRPLRGSFRLAPLICAIGISIFLANFAQVAQGARNKPISPMVRGIYVLFERDGYTVTISDKQIIMATTAIVLTLFWYIVQKTPLGRAQRACEQDRRMAALLGINVDRTIDLTFVFGAGLAAVAGTMHLVNYGVVSFSDGFVPGIKAFTATVLGGLIIGLIETFWSSYFDIAYKDVAAFSILAIVLIFMPSGILARPDVEKV